MKKLSAPALFISFLAFAAPAMAAQTCVVNSSCTVGEFLYDDDYVPVTTATCTLTSRYPDGTLYLNAQGLTATSDGWYAHQFTAPSTTGYHRSQMCCTVSGELMCLDKSFEVQSAVLGSSDVASAVWGYSSRTMTGFGDLVSNIWTSSLANFATKTDVAAVQKTAQETRNALEAIINKPVIENTIEEEKAEDISNKVSQTESVLNQLLLDVQEIISTTQTDKIASVVDQIAWLKSKWSWPQLDEMQDQVEAVKLIADSLSLARGAEKITQTKTLTDYLKVLQRQIKNSTGKIGQIKSLTQILNEEEARIDTLLAQWPKINDLGQKQLKVDQQTKTLLAVNRLPKGNVILEPVVTDVSEDSRLKNKALSIKYLIRSNRNLIAQESGKVLVNTWVEEGSMVFKSVVANPSQLISQTAKVSYYLPVEIKQADIITTSFGLNVSLDKIKNQLLVEGEFLLKPDESKTLSVRVKDVWTIDEQQIANTITEMEKLKKSSASDLESAWAEYKNAVTPEEKIIAHRTVIFEIENSKELMTQLKTALTKLETSGAVLKFVDHNKIALTAGILITWFLSLIVVFSIRHSPRVFKFMSVFLISLAISTTSSWLVISI